MGFVERLLVLATQPQTRNDRIDTMTVWLAPVLMGLIFSLLGVVLRPLRKRFRALGVQVEAFVNIAVSCVILLSVPSQFQILHVVILALGISIWVSPALLSHQVRLKRWAVWSSIPLTLATLGPIGWAGITRIESVAESEKVAPADRPNVLMIVMDTVRAESTSLIDSPRRDTTPHLLSWSQRGTRFDRAISTAPWTLPSHASMFTGRWPHELNVGADRALDERYPTLAERLKEQGYATGGFVSNLTFCHRRFGLHRGFDHYDDEQVTLARVVSSSPFGKRALARLAIVPDSFLKRLGLAPGAWSSLDHDRRFAAEILENASSWIERQQDRPWFAFINLMDAHDPYLLPGGTSYQFAPTPRSYRDVHRIHEWPAENPSQDEIREALDNYESCIFDLDRRIHNFFNRLKSKNLLSRTLVVVTSDHGEHFGEHSIDGIPLFAHVLSTHQQEVRVPLMIFGPSCPVTDHSVPEAVSLRQLPATIFDLIQVPGEGFPGSSLFSSEKRSDASKETSAHDFDVLAELELRDQKLLRDRLDLNAGTARTTIGEGWSYLVHPDRPDELYDLTNDPQEQTNLIDSEDEATRQILQRRRDDLKRLVPEEIRAADHEL